MAVFGGEMEASTVVKWPMAIHRGERKRESIERERGRKSSNEEEEEGPRILTLGIIITDRYSVGKKQTKRFISLINTYRWNIRR